MVGRAAMGYPWIFKEIKSYLEYGEIPEPPDVEERVNICRRHLKENIRGKGEKYAVVEMRKLFRHYFKGIPHFKPFRIKLYEATTLDEVEHVFDRIIEKLSQP